MRGNQPQDGKAKRGFPRSRFTHHAQRLPGPHQRIKPVDGLDMANGLAEKSALDRKPDLQVFRFNHNGSARIGFGRLALGLRRQQHLGVLMLRLRKHRLGVAGLNHLAPLHHANRIRHVAHDSKVMGDQQQRHAVFGLQFLQQLQNLRLYRHVKRRGGFIGNQQVRIIGKRHGNHDALPLPAGQLMRVVLQPRFGIADANLGEQADDPLPRLRSAQALMQFEDFADLLFHRMQRIERGHRFLENHGDVVAAHLAQVAFIRIEQFLAIELDRTGRMLCRRIGQELENGKCGNRFAGA